MYKSNLNGKQVEDAVALTKKIPVFKKTDAGKQLVVGENGEIIAVNAPQSENYKGTPANVVIFVSNGELEDFSITNMETGATMTVQELFGNEKYSVFFNYGDWDATIKGDAAYASIPLVKTYVLSQSVEAELGSGTTSTFGYSVGIYQVLVGLNVFNYYLEITITTFDSRTIRYTFSL